MEKKNLCIAFSTQKGGAGKTTLTVLVASYLHYVKGYDVAVVDCDYPQYSIAEMRERDLRMATDDDYYKSMAYEQFTRLGKKMYPVIRAFPRRLRKRPKPCCRKVNTILSSSTCPERSIRKGLFTPFRLWIISSHLSVPTGWFWKVPCVLPTG